MSDQKLREQIDACRADSDDLHAPEMGELAAAIERDAAVARQFEAAQQFDRAFRTAAHDVAVPPGLLEKLLAAAEAQAAEPSVESSINEPVEPAAEAPAVSSRRRLTRRVVMALASLAALALIGVAIRPLLQPPPKVISASELAERAEQWLVQSFPESSWNTNLASAPRESHPIDSIVLGREAAWRSVRTIDSSDVVAYDLSPAGAPRAYLFVVRTSARYSVAAPPGTTSLSASHGMKMAAWQRGNHLYVLAVEEVGGQRLDSYLRRPQLTLRQSRSTWHG